MPLQFFRHLPFESTYLFVFIDKNFGKGDNENSDGGRIFTVDFGFMNAMFKLDPVAISRDLQESRGPFPQRPDRNALFRLPGVRTHRPPHGVIQRPWKPHPRRSAFTFIPTRYDFMSTVDSAAKPHPYLRAARLARGFGTAARTR